MEHAVAATPAWAVLAYLVAGVLFILSLRGLSSPESSQAGNRNGMIGMAVAVGTTLILHPTGLPLIIGAIAIGGGIGWVIAQRIQMTAMPELVAGFHSLVGMAAVLVGCAAYLPISTRPPSALLMRPARSLPCPVSKWAWAWPSAPSPSPARSSPS